MNVTLGYLLCAALLSACIGYTHGADVSLTQQESILTSLAAAGAVVFGILGAWIAIIYPRTYEQSVDREIPIEIAEERVLFFIKCLWPMITSCAIFITSLVALPIIAWLVKPDTAASESIFARQFFFGTCILLTLAQVFAMIQSLLPVIDSKDTLIETISRRKRGDGANGAPRGPFAISAVPPGANGAEAAETSSETPTTDAPNTTSR